MVCALAARAGLFQGEEPRMLCIFTFCSLSTKTFRFTGGVAPVPGIDCFMWSGVIAGRIPLPYEY